MDFTNAPIADRSGDPQAAFEAAARAAGCDPENKWIGGYVLYEWDHLRPLTRAYGLDFSGRKILEFGCNVGASSIVIAALGGQVTGIDVDSHMAAIAKANVDRHALSDRVTIQYVPDTRQQPFESGQFDYVIANSVLEYVDPDHLAAVIKEIARILKPGGRLFICGTASRVAPREIHSRRWFVNYLPRWFDRLTGKKWQRGISPFALSSALAGDFDDVSGDCWQAGRAAIHGRLTPPMKAFAMITRLLSVGPGWAAPNIELLLRRR